MKKYFSLLFFVLGISITIQAQFSRHIVKLKNKGGSAFTLANPQAYLSQRAIDRRTNYGIAIDSTDLPVTPNYITQIRNIPGVTVLNVSKWLNAITIHATDPAALTAVGNLPFVESVAGLARLNGSDPERESKQPVQTDPYIPVAGKLNDVQADYFNYGTGSYNEIHLHNGEFLHNIGLRGQGMQVAVLDGGFQNYNTLDAFDSANINGQILSTWDFVSGNTNVADDHPHGMQCLSTIVANIPGQFVGKAPKASFHLFRTEETATEYPIEEFNWVAGAERADSSGANIISSSLGYFDFDNPVFDHVYSDMDGNTTMAAIGADMAAKKGLIVFNSIGNEGNGSWHFLATPSDGDSVVAVGAVSQAGTVGGFSSYGPSADGQIKPDMASVGVAAMVQTTANTIGVSSGTSFACPNMAGLGTCLWQGFPEYNNMRIIRALREAGHKFTNPDDRVGYGIPDMRKAFGSLLTEYSVSSSSITGCRVTVNWNSKDVSSMKYEIERKAPGEINFTKVGEMNPAGGAILSTTNYQFTNDLINGSAGMFSYRIRQILDTSAANFYAVYTDTTSINISTACVITGFPNPDPDATTISVLPNPATGSSVSLVIESPNAINPLHITLYDSKGSMLLQLQDSKTSGRKTIELSTAKLSAGKYFVVVRDGQKTIGTSILVKL